MKKLLTTMIGDLPLWIISLISAISFVIGFAAGGGFR